MKFIKATQSVCPEDLRVLDAELWEIDGQVIMRKTCPDHGSFEDVYWSDYGEYIRANRFRDDGTGLLSAVEPRLGCPHDCGVCQEHRTHTGLLLIDVTNRCNLQCLHCASDSGPARENEMKVLGFQFLGLEVTPESRRLLQRLARAVTHFQRASEPSGRCEPLLPESA